MRSPSQPEPIAAVSVVVGRFDDLFARGLRELLSGDRSLAIVAQDIERRRIGVVLRAHRPDVAILDAGGLAKLAEVRELSVEHPATRLVLFAHELSAVECAQLLAFGASACLARDTQSRDVLTAVHLASRGLKVAPGSSDAHSRWMADGQLLTRREGEVLPLLAHGDSNAKIALALQIGVETVRTHARNIYRKLGVCSRSELSAPQVLDREDPAGYKPHPARPRQPGRLARSRRGHDARRG